MKSPDPTGVPKGGLQKFLAGFSYAIAGLRYAVQTQCNIRVHLMVAAAALALAAVLKMSLIEIAVVLLTIALVLAAELFNTAIETCVDLVSPKYHALARITKDVSAAAVLVCAVIAGLIGLLLYVPALCRALGW